MEFRFTNVWIEYVCMDAKWTLIFMDIDFIDTAHMGHSAAMERGYDTLISCSERLELIVTRLLQNVACLAILCG